MDKKPCVAWLSFDLLHELFFRVQPQPHEITIFIAPPGFLKQEKESGKNGSANGIVVFFYLFTFTK